MERRVKQGRAIAEDRAGFRTQINLRPPREKSIWTSTTFSLNFLAILFLNTMASVASQPAKQRPVKPLAPTIVKRLHISGLSNPNISHADLRQRFSSFGDVQGVEGVGVDGNGAFLSRA